MHFTCRCRNVGDGIYRVLLVCGQLRENLGVLMPQNGGFLLDKKIPAKRLGQGIPEFRLTAHQEQASRIFVPVYPDEPFSYIHKLEDAFLEQRDGKQGIMIQNV